MSLDLLNEIRTYLNTYGIENVYVTALPDSISNAVGVFGSPGLPTRSKGITEPGVQIVVRNESVLTAGTLANTIHSLMDDKWNFLASIKGHCLGQAPPGAMYRDEQNRPVFSLNYQFINSKF